MTVSVCPIAVVQAPAERVWALLSEPASYAIWWDAETVTIVPAGPARPGQQITATSKALARQWPVSITVEAVNTARHAIDLTTRLPFGITVRNHITVMPLEGAASRVSFG
jgi:hypothetical protein